MSRYYPNTFLYVTDRVDTIPNKSNYILIVLDPDCGHCQHIFKEMATQGVATDKIAVLSRWSNENELAYKLGQLSRPEAFPHAIDLGSNSRLSVQHLYSLLDLRMA